MSWIENRMQAAEGRLEMLYRRLQADEVTLGNVRQQLKGAFQQLPPGGSGGGGQWALCQLASTLGAATGTWPSITPTSQASITLYQPSSGSLASIGTFTVYNWRNVSWAASKTSYVVQAPDSTWAIVDQDC